MSEPLIRRLSQFTPDASALDRDALLFAAGRASVRPKHGWMATATALAACQVLTLGLLWPRATSPIAPLGPTVPGPVIVQTPSSPPDAWELGALNQRFLGTQDGDFPTAAPADDLVPAGPPLHAFGSATPPGLD